MLERTAGVPGQANELRNCLAQLRIPIRVCRKNIQPIDAVHTEHKNKNPWAGRKSFSLARLVRIATILRKPKAIDYESHFHQLNIIIG
jgi:hypothetical protein